MFEYFILIVFLASSVISQNCNNSDSVLMCHGTRVLKNVMKSMHKDSEAPLTIVPGLEIVAIPHSEEKISNEIDARETGIEVNDSISNRVTKYFRTHELKINFFDLLEKRDFKDTLMSALGGIDFEKEVVEGRKKDKDGGCQTVMMMGMMMGKTLAALGLGSVGALALKALGVSLMALMLAAIVGLKKLSEHNQGGDHHNRKRRQIDEHRHHHDEQIPLPYRGWSNYAIEIQ